MARPLGKGDDAAPQKVAVTNLQKAVRSVQLQPDSQMSNDTQVERQELAAILRRLEVAENGGDADYIISMMADDMVMMVPNEPVQEGKEACAGFLRGMLAWMIEALDRHITYVSAEICVLGDCTFDRGTFSFTATPKSGGDTTHAQGKYFWVYSRDGNSSWKLARGIVSLDEAPEDPAEDLLIS